MEVLITGDCEDTLQKTQYSKPDIILFDAQMPEFDGFETYQRLRGVEILKDIPIIFMTGLSNPMNEIQWFDGRGVDFITKPYSYEELLARITMLQKNQEQIRRLRQQVAALSRINEKLEKEIAEHKRTEDELRIAYSEMENQLELRTAEPKRTHEQTNRGDVTTKQNEDLQRLSIQLINAQEAERKRISLELHDEMGQALTAIGINLEGLEKELPPETSANVRKRLAETILLADETLEQVREMALGLRPSLLDDLGLVPALRWLTNRLAQRLGIKTSVEAEDWNERLPSEMETVIYRVVQEALTNVARHAQANRVSVRLEYGAAMVVATIEDDGKGFDVTAVDIHSSTGLPGIRERVALLGGGFKIKSQPGQGTCLRLEIPYRRYS
jgi:signal transduction histidine kinase